MFKRIACTTVALIVLVVFAGNAKAAAKKTVDQTPSYDKVVAVDTAASTIKIEKANGKNPRTITITAFTRITVSGKPGKLEDIKSDMKVDMVCSGGNVATRIDAMDPPAPKTK